MNLNFNDCTTFRHHKKKKRRRSSGASRNSTSAPEDPMDRIVASNVDAVLLDCLEDELPSVTLDEEVPGSDPMDLIREYEGCTSLVLGRRFLRPKSDCLSRQSSSNDLSSSGKAPSSGKRPATAGKTVPPVALRPTNRKSLDGEADEAGSSSDFSGYSSSTSSSGRRKKRKRNMTGFPSPKKPKKKATLLNNVLMKETNRRLGPNSADTDDDSSTSADESEVPIGRSAAKPPVRKLKKATPSPPAAKRAIKKSPGKSPPKGGRSAKARALSKRMTEEDGDDENEDFEEKVPYRSAAFKAKLAADPKLAARVRKVHGSPPAKRKPPRPPPPPPSKAKLAKLAAAKAAKKRLQKAKQPLKTRQSRTRLR